jgi:hypothetical protein
MSEPVSIPPKPAKSFEEVKKLLEGIRAVALSQSHEIKKPDKLAIDEKRQLEFEGERETLKQKKRVNWARLILLIALFALIVLWICSVMAVTLLDGFHWRGFSLPEKVLITYITTTTASVFGLFYIGAKWLFAKDTHEH